MMRTLLLAAGLAVVALMTNLTTAQEPKKGKKSRAPYVHVVIFQMKKDTPSDAIGNAIADCHALLSKVPSVRSVRAGRPAEKATPEFGKKNYDFALLVLLDDADGLKTYLEHPLHLQFVEKHGKHFDMTKLQVFDFMNQMK